MNRTIQKEKMEKQSTGDKLLGPTFSAPILFSLSTQIFSIFLSIPISLLDPDPGPQNCVHVGKITVTVGNT